MSDDERGDRGNMINLNNNRRGLDKVYKDPEDASKEDIANAIKRNEYDIVRIRDRIEAIKDGTLEHMKNDIKKLSDKVEKIDNRLWTIIMLLIGSIVIPIVMSIYTGTPGK